MYSNHVIIVLFVVSGLGAASALLLRRTRSKLSLPPSLKGNLLFGHLFMLPASEEHIAYRDIGKQLNSDIISFTVPGQVIVVLNSIESATDLLAKRGIVYANRAGLTMLNDERLAGWERNTGCLPYGERWKKQRTMTQSVLHPAAGGELWPKMIKQTRLSMQRLLYNPEGISEELEWMTAAIMVSSLYGYEASYPHDGLIHNVKTGVAQFCEAAVPSNFFVNTIPWLIYVPSWLPGTSWKRKAAEYRAGRDKVVNDTFDWTISQLATGAALPSILKTLLTSVVTSEMTKQSIQDKEDIARWAVGTLYAAGTDTTVATEIVFVLAMLLHPEVQKKAQAELDSVLGGRLPELNDRKVLPYLNAVMKEVMRWYSVVPMGVPRAAMKDDVYRGFLIPKNAIVLMNVWAISNDPRTYVKPEEFNPDRFLNTELASAPVFGIGRRDCPGVHFAESSFFIMASTFLTVFDVNPIPGKPYLPKKYDGNTLSSYPTFDCMVTPRSENHQRLIEEWVEI